MADREANKALVRRHVDEPINRRHSELWTEIMREDFDAHHPLTEAGRAGIADGQLAEVWIQEDDLAFNTQLFGPEGGQDR